MKKFSLFLIAALTITFFVSCEDSDGDYYTGATLITVVPMENNNYYFQLDNGETIYPSINLVSNYELSQNAQRAIIYYRTLDIPIEGYNHSIKLFGIENILTKDMIKIDTEDELDKIGDDPININKIWIGGGYLNIFFEFPSNLTSTKHYINVIKNAIETKEANLDKYITLEFRHNAYEDTQGYMYQGAAAFKINDLIEDTCQGIYLRVKNTTGNITYHKIELKSNDK